MVRNLEKIKALKRWVVESVVLGGEEVGAGWERRSMWQWLGFLRRTKEEDERDEREYVLPVSRDPLAMILLLVQRKTDVKANERGGFKEREAWPSSLDERQELVCRKSPSFDENGI